MRHLDPVDERSGRAVLDIGEDRGGTDVAAESDRALEGFREGRYRVLLDGQPVTSLDEPLSLGLRSRVTFVRVVPLVSG